MSFPRIELLNPQSPFTDFQNRGKKIKKFAVVCRIPTLDNTYYPIPYYAVLFKEKWFNVKQFIGIGKEAKFRNSAPIKYHIEIANPFLNNIFKVESITDCVKQHDVVINKIETDKEGRYWAADTAEAINMMYFTMFVHSNLVGSVPGKSQTNNSGSDKRELYTIAQALQKTYHDLLFSLYAPHLCGRTRAACASRVYYNESEV